MKRRKTEDVRNAGLEEPVSVRRAGRLTEFERWETEDRS